MIYEPTDFLNPHAQDHLSGEIKRKRIWLRIPRTSRIRRKCAQAWCRFHAGSYSNLIRSILNFAIARNYKFRSIDRE